MTAMFDGRCPLCDWPLKATMEEGCALGSCSYRPSDHTAEAARLDRRRVAIREEIAVLTATIQSAGRAIAASLETTVGIEDDTLAFLRAVYTRTILRCYVEGTNA